MTVKSYEEQLLDIQAAIDAVQNGAQSYTIAGRTLTRADLKTLYKREEYLRAMVRRGPGGKIRVRGALPV